MIAQIYKKHFLPKILDRGMKSIRCEGSRSNVASKASGVVLEIGFGSGYNIPFYNNIEKLYALEPSQEMFNLAENKIRSASFPVEHLNCSAEHIPLPDNSIDCVTSTWVLCSIPDAKKALIEVRRVLKPNGLFIFAEHGISQNGFFAFIQRLVSPLTSKFTGNCKLDKHIDSLISEAGFKFENLKTSSESKKPLMYTYRGVATKKLT